MPAVLQLIWISAEEHLLNGIITSLKGATADHGNGTLNYAYDANQNKTTITGVTNTRTWIGNGDAISWTNSVNWSPGFVPTINNPVYLDKSTDFTARISSGNQYIGAASQIGVSSAGSATLSVQGGTLTAPSTYTYLVVGNATEGVLQVDGDSTVNLPTDSIWLGYGELGILDINSGTVNCRNIDAGLTPNEHPVIYMTGGELNVSEIIFWPENAGASADIYLDGGTINAGYLFGPGWTTFDASGTNVNLDISGGKLILTGNITSLNGATAYDGNGILLYEYNSASNKTTITATGRPYYVDANGNDNNPGTISQPFATLEKARDTIRNLSPLPDGGVTVFIRGGKYFRSSEFSLTSQDCGTAQKPIIYRAYPGETVRIIGGVQLPSNGWLLVDSSDPYWSQIDTSARGYVYKAYLPNCGVSNVGGLRERSPWGPYAYEISPLELGFNGQIMKLAQWTNSGYAYTSTGGTNSFTYPSSETRPSRWTSATYPWIFGYFSFYYADYYEDVSNINTGTRTITLNPQYSFTASSGMPYRAINLLIELDSAGEYYIERNNNFNMLYFWPPSSVAAGESIVSTLGENRERIVNAVEAQYITFKDIIFEMCRAEAIRIKCGSHITLDGFTIRYTGNAGVSINAESDAVANTYHTVKNCTIYDTGKQGVYVCGGNRATLQKSYNLINNNEIYNFGRWTHCGQPAVMIHGCGNTVTHNYMHDAPGGAIVYGTWSVESAQFLDLWDTNDWTFKGYRDGANDNVIAYNEIEAVCKETGDAGIIYSGLDWGNQGNIIQYNFIHDVPTNIFNQVAHGIYLDECSRELTSSRTHFIMLAVLRCLWAVDAITVSKTMYLRNVAGHFMQTDAVFAI
ncbi:MAG: hypothetical protein A2Y12_15415 [Planctomycetes bacterium GWF2_42_9]|nr:MAG: hypothetical protein A2Y12_15415 [Planctomycetes bacterium GWF2_42_9]